MRNKHVRNTTELDVKTLSDAEILSLSVRSPDYFEEIVSRYERLFLRKAMSILHSEEDAYDVVQDSFVRIYTSARKFRSIPGASFSSWAYRVLINQCYTVYKKRNKHAVLSIESHPEVSDTTPDEASVAEIENQYNRDYVVTMISKLPVLLRRVVESYFLKGQPQKVIARNEGVSEGVIRTRIHRAKAELRKMDLQFAYIKNNDK